MIKLKDLLKETEDYVGQHSAPAKEDSPLYDLTGTYPDDIYSYDAARLYGDSGGDQNDKFSISIIQSARNMPNLPIKIYRAVPYTKSNEELIDQYEKEKKYILKYGKLPSTAAKGFTSKSQYYEYISNELDKLKTNPTVNSSNITTINPGDWVTINKNYVIEHGESNLKNQYKILTKTVKAKELFTDGNSIHEWGYNP